MKIKIQLRKPSLEIYPITRADLDAILHVYKHREKFLVLGPVPAASTEMVLKDIEISEGEGSIFCSVYKIPGKMIGIKDVRTKHFHEYHFQNTRI